jgi:predicted glycogen debranching enzyme
MDFPLDKWFETQLESESIERPSYDPASIEPADTREWLVCNGLGSYASGCISGAHTRRYHGLLVASHNQSSSRTVLFSRIDEHVGGENISTNLWTPDVVNPRGYEKISAFSIYPCPFWVMEVESGFLIKQVFMLPGKQHVYVGYSWLSKEDGPEEQTIDLHMIANHRDIHSDTRGNNNWQFQQVETPDSVILKAYEGAAKLHITYSKGEWRPDPSWYYGYYYPREQERGLTDREDGFHAGVLSCKLKHGESMLVVGSLEPLAEMPFLDEALQEVVDHQEALLSAAGDPIQPAIRNLVLAANNFIVRHPSANTHSIVAGYHWFYHWGRDSMISLPGLTLYTGRTDVARSILANVQSLLSEGMLPNNYQGQGQNPQYNSSDATLWWAWALKKYVAASKDTKFMAAAIPAMESVVEHHVKGTRFNIRMDEKDGLISGGADGVQLTWMDAKVGDLVVTPRRGKAVEISALWYHFLKTLSEFKQELGQDAARYVQMAEKTRRGFQAFWNPQRKCLFDLIKEDGSKDDSIRPNQILAVSLSADLLPEEQRRGVLSVIEAELLTPLGLRSLSSKHADYKPLYGSGKRVANQYERDICYHQGTVWAWLLGPWIDARMSLDGRTEENVREINNQLALLLNIHLTKEAGLGSISEIFDGKIPHKPQGCIAQAWSVAELLRAFGEYPELHGRARSLDLVLA